MREQNPIWSDPKQFIRDRWEEKAESEEKENLKTKLTFEDLFRIAGQAKKEEEKELLEELVADVLKSAQNYNKARERTKKLRDKEEEGVSSDKARKIAHERLLDALNILERNCRRLGVDSSWREKIGEEREKIGNWAVEEAFNYTKQ